METKMDLEMDAKMKTDWPTTPGQSCATDNLAHPFHRNALLLIPLIHIVKLLRRLQHFKFIWTLQKNIYIERLEGWISWEAWGFIY
jgi:hypothetical protein